MTKPFLHDDFLLDTKTGRRLFHEVAAELPIIDYHCHLSPADIANDRRFEHLHEAWLAGDHYKWRAMRINGIAERFCTGDASPYEKFLAFARTVPMALRNPLYHWSHLELLRHFGISELLDENSAPGIWEMANAALAEPGLSVRGIFKKMRVGLVVTTDDPLDSLEAHRAVAADECPTKVLPGFRPDRSMGFGDLPAWNSWVDRLGGASGRWTSDLAGFLDALRLRHDFFHANGCRLSDYGLEVCPSVDCTDEEAESLFLRARAGERIAEDAAERLAGYVLRFLIRLDAEKGWVMQLHIGALRNNSSRGFAALGRDAGFDSISDRPQAGRLARLLDALDRTGHLPKTILYNLNPAENYVFATMAGNFNDGSSPGKVQFGSGWWFLDQKEGMEWQMNALGNLGLLSRFVGMLTDSRSFLSYPRHEYFRRILCGLLGREAESGLLPDSPDLLAQLVRRVCHDNARQYFPFWDSEETDA